MNYSLASTDWQAMYNYWESKQTEVSGIGNIKNYDKAIARYVAGCILYGLTEHETAAGKKVFTKLFEKIKAIAPRGNDFIVDIKETYNDKIKRIVLDVFSYKTPEMEANFHKMTKRGIKVDLSIFDAIDDD